MKQRIAVLGESNKKSTRVSEKNTVAVSEAAHLENGMIEIDDGLSSKKCTLLSVVLCDV